MIRVLEVVSARGVVGLRTLQTFRFCHVDRLMGGDVQSSIARGASGIQYMLCRNGDETLRRTEQNRTKTEQILRSRSPSKANCTLTQIAE